MQRGQLNKHLLEMWLELSQGEQMSYKLLAGMSVEESPDHESQAEPKNKAVEKVKLAINFLQSNHFLL